MVSDIRNDKLSHSQPLDEEKRPRPPKESARRLLTLHFLAVDRLGDLLLLVVDLDDVSPAHDGTVGESCSFGETRQRRNEKSQRQWFQKSEQRVDFRVSLGSETIIVPGEAVTHLRLREWANTSAMVLRPAAGRSTSLSGEQKALRIRPSPLAGASPTSTLADLMSATERD